jgi:hypothetical protein
MLALPIALEHPAVSTNPQVLCAAARACKAWREAVQQSSVCNTVVVLNKKSSIPQLRSFAAWLPKHAQLVRSIHADVYLNMFGVVNRDQECVAMGQQLQEALQAAAAATAAAAAAQGAVAQPLPAALSAAEAAPATGSSATDTALAAPYCQQHLQRWRLASFSCNVQGAAGMLDALPAHSLTHLELGLAHSRETSLKELLAGLVRLSSLQLKLAMFTQVCDSISDSCLTCLARLTQLTSLELEGYAWDGVFVQQLLHQPLPQLQQLQLKFQTRLPALDLAHLTQLQRLTGDSSDGRFSPAEGFVLPAQLQHLQLMVADSGRALASVLPLQQLQHLDLLANFTEQQPLLQLTQLPALQHITLRYRSMYFAAQAAAAWAQLPQLREMRLEDGDFDGRPPSEDEMEMVMQGLAGCTGLTKLVLFCNAAEEALDPYVEFVGDDPYIGNGSDEDGYSAGGSELGDGMEDVLYLYIPAAVCGSVAGLAGLQDRTVTCGEGHMTLNDAMALTAISGLTRLHMEAAYEGVSTHAACALTSSLTKLCDWLNVVI